MPVLNDGIIGDRTTWDVADDSSPLVIVKLSDRVSVKMREAEARKRGLLPEAKPANKDKKQSKNKTGG